MKRKKVRFIQSRYHKQVGTRVIQASLCKTRKLKSNCFRLWILLLFFSSWYCDQNLSVHIFWNGWRDEEVYSKTSIKTFWKFRVNRMSNSQEMNPEEKTLLRKRERESKDSRLYVNLHSKNWIHNNFHRRVSREFMTADFFLNSRGAMMS